MFFYQMLPDAIDQTTFEMIIKRKDIRKRRNYLKAANFTFVFAIFRIVKKNLKILSTIR